MEYYSTEYHRGSGGGDSVDSCSAGNLTDARLVFIELPLEVVVLYFCSTWQITRVNHGGRSKENQSKWQKKNCRSGHIHPLVQIYLHRLSLWHCIQRPGYQPPQVVRQQLGPQSQAKLRPSTPPPTYYTHDATTWADIYDKQNQLHWYLQYL